MRILVVVAIIQVRTLKAEVEKGFTRTAIGRELVDPKEKLKKQEKWGDLGWIVSISVLVI